MLTLFSRKIGHASHEQDMSGVARDGVHKRMVGLEGVWLRRALASHHSNGGYGC